MYIWVLLSVGVGSVYNFDHEYEISFLPVVSFVFINVHFNWPINNILCVTRSCYKFIMNKGGAGGGGGPTAAAALAAAQKQKTLQQRVDNDIGNIVDNFSFIVNVARVLLLPLSLHVLAHMTIFCSARNLVC